MNYFYHATRRPKKYKFKITLGFSSECGKSVFRFRWSQHLVTYEAQVLLGFPVSISECWDGSLYSKLLLHASHAAHQDQIKTPQIYVCYV